MNYAGFWKRAAAAFIDVIVTTTVSIIITLVFAIPILFTPDIDEDMAYIIIQITYYIWGTIIGWVYAAVFESSTKQATLGKIALGIIVTDLNGNRVSFAKASGRYFGKIISLCICYIGILMAAFTEKKQGLHDMMAGCLVIEKS
tara:strand:- start:865 stop:1296 length:432 start_codon:yes stop_codon:yes gene_type:complete